MKFVIKYRAKRYTLLGNDVIITEEYHILQEFIEALQRIKAVTNFELLECYSQKSILSSFSLKKIN